MKFVDFHVHIDFYKNPEIIINLYEKSQIYALFVTNLPQIYEKHLVKYNKYNYIKLALGYHPEMIDFYSFDKELFDAYINTTNYIGEVGIDGSKKNFSNIDKQSLIFDYICNKVKNKSKILTIHSKKAESNVLDILKNHNIEYAIFHWYSGSIKLIDDILQCGYYFSVNPNMLCSQKGRDILYNIPLDRILFESDGPFTKYDKFITSPEYFNQIFKEFDAFYKIDNFKKIVYSNFKNLLIDRQLSEEKNKLLINYNN